MVRAKSTYLCVWVLMLLLSSLLSCSLFQPYPRVREDLLSARSETKAPMKNVTGKLFSVSWNTGCSLSSWRGSVVLIRFCVCVHSHVSVGMREREMMEGGEREMGGGGEKRDGQDKERKMHT